MTYDKRKLKGIVEAFSGRRIAVVGDLILDEFVWGKVERISPEAPVPVVEVVRESVHLGGAANVAANLAALGACPLLVGVVGADEPARRLLEQLERLGIEARGVVTDGGRNTTIKTRIIAHHQQVCRMDRENRAPFPESTFRRLEEAARRAIRESEAVIFSDYAKGVLAPAVTGPLLQLCRREGKFSAVDPKNSDFSLYRRASIVTPNLKEAERASGVLIQDGESLQAAGRRLLETAEADYLLVTRGEEGMTLFDRKEVVHLPTTAREVFDVTGAGDTVVAVLALAVAAGASVPEAAALANHAAGVVVGKLGTAAATVEELVHSLQA